jgi:hypothetical protein
MEPKTTLWGYEASAVVAETIHIAVEAYHGFDLETIGLQQIGHA